MARAEREVILAGGAINSPQLLMLSGIGDPAELAAHRIPVKLALKGVGKNLQDHVSAAVSYRRKQSGPFHRNMRLDRIALALGRAYFLGGGFATDLPFGVTAFVKTRAELKAPDVQILFWMGPTTTAAPYLSPFKPPFEDGFSCRAMPLRPESRGSLRLASSDPGMPIRIHQSFLATDEDWRTMRAGFRMLRDIGRETPLAPFIAGEIAPGAGCVSDADIDAHIRATSITVHHPIGTCKMGPASDDMSVVDGELRVRGVDGLRVVDASVMPDLIGGATNAPVMMIAEKASDLIRGRPPLPAANV
jgi:choline dehydrogenase/4-pyridoxate dehydrogenase